MRKVDEGGKKREPTQRQKREPTLRGEGGTVGSSTFACDTLTKIGQLRAKWTQNYFILYS